MGVKVDLYKIVCQYVLCSVICSDNLSGLAVTSEISKLSMKIATILALLASASAFQAPLTSKAKTSLKAFENGK